MAIFSFGGKNVPKNTLLSVSTLPNNKYTWEADQSWWTFHDWTLWIVSWVYFYSYWDFYGHFHFLWQKVSPKHNICPYLPFILTNAPRKWINLDVPSMLLFVDSFLGEFPHLLRVIWAFSLLGAKHAPQNTYLFISTLSITNTPGNRSTLMYLPWLDFVDSFLSEFSQLLRVLWAFSLFGVKMSQKEHICPYLPFTPTTTFRKQIYLDVLSMTGLSGSLPGWFSLIIKVTMGAFTFWGKKCPKNTYLSVSTLPDNKYNQKMDQSWWTFHDWTLWISSWVIFFH